VKLIIHNTFVVFEGIVFIQTNRISIGGNPSSPIADLTVGKKEFNHMKRLLQDKKIRNDFHLLIKKDICPQSLEMKSAGNKDKEIDYLDLNINISVSHK
jgi:hypothetical protein